MTGGGNLDVVRHDAGSGGPRPTRGVVVLQPSWHDDDRGAFREVFNDQRMRDEVGVDRQWPQDNHSWSRRGVLRGIHFQVGTPQGKLVWCPAGAVFDVAVDLRPDSPSFGCWFGLELSESNGRQLWIPEGFGHGFLATSERAHVMYKVTTPYVPGASRTLAFDDPAVGIEWPTSHELILSDADANGLDLAGVKALMATE